MWIARFGNHAARGLDDKANSVSGIASQRVRSFAETLRIALRHRFKADKSI